MDEANVEKIVIIATHGGEDPERACLPFVLANASLAMDTQAVVILQGTAVTLAKKGCYEHVFAAGLPPLKELVDSFMELGGTLLVCGNGGSASDSLHFAAELVGRFEKNRNALQENRCFFG